MKKAFSFIKKFKFHISSSFLMVLFTALGLYYSFSFIPGRQAYSTLATNLVYARAALQGENDICDKDPNLKNAQNHKEMEKLQNKLADLLNTIDASAAYDKKTWGSQIHREETSFSKWGWNQYFYINDHHQCPTTRKTNKELFQWINGMISQFPHYWFF